MATKSEIEEEQIIVHTEYAVQRFGEDGEKVRTAYRFPDEAGETDFPYGTTQRQDLAWVKRISTKKCTVVRVIAGARGDFDEELVLGSIIIFSAEEVHVMQMALRFLINNTGRVLDFPCRRVGGGIGHRKHF